MAPETIAKLSLSGMGLDVLGGCYLAYDLLGGKRGPLRTIARAIGYVAVFFVGYAVVLGLRYAVVAATGMGILLAVEFRIAASDRPQHRKCSGSLVFFGFLRGCVLGLAGMTISSPTFGSIFGLLSGAGLVLSYLIGFSPTHDYEAVAGPRMSRHKILASLFRALAVGIAGVVAAVITGTQEHSLIFGLRLGLAAGTVSALVSLVSPVIEWRIENLPERRLGMMGITLILAGVLLQSVQYWVVVLNVPMP